MSSIFLRLSFKILSSWNSSASPEDFGSISKTSRIFGRIRSMASVLDDGQSRKSRIRCFFGRNLAVSISSRLKSTSPSNLDSLHPISLFKKRFSYEECDVGTLWNQTTPAGAPASNARGGRTAFNGKYNTQSLSWLQGQKLSACTCPDDDHPGKCRLRRERAFSRAFE